MIGTWTPDDGMIETPSDPNIEEIIDNLYGLLIIRRQYLLGCLASKSLRTLREIGSSDFNFLHFQMTNEFFSKSWSASHSISYILVLMNKLNICAIGDIQLGLIIVRKERTFLWEGRSVLLAKCRLRIVIPPDRSELVMPAPDRSLRAQPTAGGSRCHLLTIEVGIAQESSPLGACPLEPSLGSPNFR